MAVLMPPDRRPRPLRALCDLDDAHLVEIALHSKDVDEFAFRLSAADAADYAARLVERYRESQGEGHS